MERVGPTQITTRGPCWHFVLKSDWGDDVADRGPSLLSYWKGKACVSHSFRVAETSLTPHHSDHAHVLILLTDL